MLWDYDCLLLIPFSAPKVWSRELVMHLQRKNLRQVVTGEETPASQLATLTARQRISLQAGLQHVCVNVQYEDSLRRQPRRCRNVRWREESGVLEASPAHLCASNAMVGPRTRACASIGESIYQGYQNYPLWRKAKRHHAHVHWSVIRNRICGV